MGHFRKKPVVIEAWCNTEEGPHRSPAPDWILKAIDDGTIWIGGGIRGFMNVKTLNGRVRAEYGEWIVRGVEGELYPCKAEIFAETYEPA